MLIKEQEVYPTLKSWPLCLLTASGYNPRSGTDFSEGYMIPSRILLGTVFSIASVPALAVIHHDLQVTIDPAAHRITVQDKIRLHRDSAREFFLHEGLNPGVNGEALAASGGVQTAAFPVPVQRFQLPGDGAEVTLHYQGELYHPLAKEGDQYARSFGETAGTIESQGVFLAGPSYWYPVFNSDELMTFELSVTLPQGWQAVSQGSYTPNGSQGVVWREQTAQQEIYLIAAPFERYSQAAGGAEAMVYLRAKDPALAQQYLDATVQYLALYRQLIGPYAYDKFALVENFWETGYGMPSFTLLGSQVIRLPFIIHSSYPHEILHNWWGNGVYVDYASGNWAEGLTAYLADHLINEQRGQGVGHRRQILQHYTDFVAEQKDFPLTEFRSRHSSVSEAVGYGKTQMLFHMLRRKLGDELFVRGLQQFYRQHRFKVAGFDDVQQVFSQVAQQDLTAFFHQWVRRTGSPQLQLNKVISRQKGKGYELTVEVEQMQAGEPYQLELPVAITLADEVKAWQEVRTIDKRKNILRFTFEKQPLHISLDPGFDLFRRLDREEIPPALSQAFGADKALLVLPSKADKGLIKAYHQLAQSWSQTQSFAVEVKLDSEIVRLPDDRTVWLLGWGNRFAGTLDTGLQRYGAQANGQGARIGKTRFKTDQALVVTLRNERNPQQAIVWIASDNTEAVPGLARKLPHYRRYSYLAFDGDEPSNSFKGQWQVDRSPMQQLVGDIGGLVVPASLADEPVLAQLPAVFNEQRMLQDVSALADKSLQGRGLGSKELDRAADYIAKAFAEAGLLPGNGKSYRQSWRQKVEGLGDDVPMSNVIGVIPGRNPAFAGQSVVISAHYDHLGLGWPDAKAGNQGKIHYGADDNASGVAVMLELARLAHKWQPQRSLVFVAFTGEEAGKLGSQYYVANYKEYPTAKAMGVLNLDTVGRLGKNPVTIFATGSASEWIHILRGAQFVTGIEIKAVAEDIGGSDQTSFQAVGVPAVQFFGGQHLDFHTPGDTIDKIDSAGLAKVAAIVQEAGQYLVQRPQPLSASGKPVGDHRAAPPAGRKVSVGTVPDFAYPGPGVRITDVVAASPAALAGLQGGDIITAIDGAQIENLRGYSSVLKGLQPGARIQLQVKRGEQELNITVQVVER